MVSGGYSRGLEWLTGLTPQPYDIDINIFIRIVDVYILPMIVSINQDIQYTVFLGKNSPLITIFLNYNHENIFETKQ